MPARNQHTGEVQLRDSNIRIVLTARAWVAIEEQLRKSILQILQDASLMAFGIKELVVIIGEGAEAYALRNRVPAPSDDDVLSLIDEYGLDLMEDVATAIQGSPALGLHIQTKESAEGADAAPLA